MKVQLVILIFLIFYFGYYRNRSRLRYGVKFTLTHLKQENNLDIPKQIHQTYFDKSKIPEKVKTNLLKYAGGYDVNFYDDEDIKKFLKTHFSIEVLKCFETLKNGAHKADLFRYCILYAYGGIYLDIKTELIQDIQELFPPGTVSTVATSNELIYQGVIASPPRQEIFLTLIDGILRSGTNFPYNLFLRDFMRYIRKDCDIKKIHKNGSVLTGKKHKYKIFYESISNDSSQCYDGLDRYGICSYITYEGKRIMKTRYSDYPWK